MSKPVPQQIAESDFSAAILLSLRKQGITLIGIQAIPGPEPMPWANASRGYVLDDNGTCIVRSYAQVVLLGSSKSVPSSISCA